MAAQQAQQGPDPGDSFMDITQSSLFLDIPMDILLCIADHLDLHDEFNLAQSCRSFRAAFGRDWSAALQQLSHEQRFKFWQGVAYSRPDIYACRVCAELHCIDVEDTPSVIMPPRMFHANEPRVPARLCQRQEQEISRDILPAVTYVARETHVQLALKFHRMGVNQDYLNAILSPSTEYFHVGNRKNISYCRIRTKPKIVAGRFLLRVEWNYTHPDLESGSRDNSKTTAQLHPVCLHLSDAAVIANRPKPKWAYAVNLAKRWFPARWAKSFENSFDDAFVDYGEIQWGGCTYCPTDYGVLLNEKRGLVIRAWYDFGSEEEPMWDFHYRHEGDENGSSRKFVPGDVGKVFNSD